MHRQHHPKNGPDGLRDVLLQCLAHERPAPRRLFCLRCPRPLGGFRGRRLLRPWRQLGDHPALLVKDIGRGRIKDTGRGRVLLGLRLLDVWLLFLLRLLHRLLQLGDYPVPPIKVSHRKVPCRSTTLRLGAHPALFLKDTGRRWGLHGTRPLGALQGMGLLFRWRLLLLPLSRGPGLRVPLSHLLKNAPHGLRDTLVQVLAHQRPAPRWLFCLRGLRPRGALRGSGLLVLVRLRGALLGLGLIFLLQLLPRLRSTPLSL